jgi:hypothetical protein
MRGYIAEELDMRITEEPDSGTPREADGSADETTELEAPPKLFKEDADIDAEPEATEETYGNEEIDETDAADADDKTLPEIKD